MDLTETPSEQKFRERAFRDEISADFEAGKIRIVNGWLVGEVGYHNCAGGTMESSGLHESWCGWEPLCDLWTEKRRFHEGQDDQEVLTRVVRDVDRDWHDGPDLQLSGSEAWQIAHAVRAAGYRRVNVEAVIKQADALEALAHEVQKAQGQIRAEVE